MLLYSTKKEAELIMQAAERLDLTGKNYVWIVTQSVIGTNEDKKGGFPVGMLGKIYLPNHSINDTQCI